LTKEFEDHMNELKKSTSGGAHDAITFSGKGLNFLRDLFKSAKGKGTGEEEEGEEKPKDEENEMGGGEEEPEEKVKKNKEGTDKNGKANGGPVTEEDEDPDEPHKGSQGTLITNHGKKVTPKGAVSKNAPVEEEEPLFKNFNDEYEEVLEASEVLGALAKNVQAMSVQTNANIAALQGTVMVLAKSLEASLKGQVALAADIELIKSQPVTSPATGFVVMEKRDAAATGGSRTLSKSDIQDVVTDALNKGEIEPMDLARLGKVRNQADLKAYVESLPESVQAQL